MIKNICVKTSLCWTPIRDGIQFILAPKRLSLLIIFAVLYVPFLFNYGWRYRDVPNIDLPSFYSASVQVFRHGESPYEPERLQAIMGERVRVFPYLYPPPSLLFFYPLSALDYATARRVVLAANHLIILALLFVIPWFLLRDQSRRGVSAEFALPFAYLLTFHPAVLTLNHGQVNLLLLAFLLLFWLLAKAGRPVSASVFLALAVFLKTYPLVILPMLFASGRRRECAYTTGWIGLGAAVSLLIVPPAIWHDWLVNVLPTGDYAHIPVGLCSPAAVWNQSLNGFFARAFTESRWSNPVFVDTVLARHLTYAAAGLVAATSGMAVFGCAGRADW